MKKKGYRSMAALLMAVLLMTGLSGRPVLSAEDTEMTETEVTATETYEMTETETAAAEETEITETEAAVETEETDVLLSENVTDEWISQFDYQIAPENSEMYPYEGYVELINPKYSFNTPVFETLEIPGSAVIDGKTYRVKLGPYAIRHCKKAVIGKDVILYDWEDLKWTTYFNDYVNYFSSAEDVVLDGCDMRLIRTLRLGRDLENVADESVHSFALKNLDLTHLTDLSYLFSGNNNMTDASLQSLDLSNVTTMNRAFESCVKLKNISFEDLKMGSLKDTSYMFYSCRNLSDVDFSGLDTSQTTNMAWMFNGCETISSQALSTLDTRAAENMDQMFAGCTVRNSLDLSSWELPNLKHAAFMFGHTPLLTLKTPKNTGCAIPLPAAYYDLETGEKYTEIPAGLDHSLTLVLYKGIPTLWQVNDNQQHIYFEWNPVEGANSYQVYRKVGNSGRVVCLGNTTETSYTDENVVWGKNYTYFVYAFDSEKSDSWPKVVDMSKGRKMSLFTWMRLAGTNRYGTMEKITKQGFPSKPGSVIITRGDDFADALTASALAGKMSCPIITTDPARLSKEAGRALTSLAPIGRVYIVGGKSAVSDAVVKDIKELTGVKTVKRIEGKNRIETALAIYYEAEDHAGGWGDTCIVVNGFGFADALSIGPYAYSSETPIFPTDKNGNLSQKQLEIIQYYFKKIIICGGDLAVKESSLKQLKVKRFQRLAGADRYETSLEIARWVAGSRKGNVFGPLRTLNAEDAAVADAMNYPDALVAVNLCNRYNSLLLLVSDNSKSKKAIEELQKLGMSHGFILGGPAAVSDKVMDWLMK